MHGFNVENNLPNMKTKNKNPPNVNRCTYYEQYLHFKKRIVKLEVPENQTEQLQLRNGGENSPRKKWKLQFQLPGELKIPRKARENGEKNIQRQRKKRGKEKSKRGREKRKRIENPFCAFPFFLICKMIFDHFFFLLFLFSLVLLTKENVR